MVGSAGVSTPPQALLVNYTSLLGGAERILLDHATALAGPVALACPEGPLADRARGLGFEVEALHHRRIELRATPRDRLAAPLRLRAQSREIRRIADRLRPRCVIGWGMRGLLSSAAALRGVAQAPPLVFHHNDLLPSPLVARAVRAAARRADLAIALSQAIADDLDPAGTLGVPLEVVRPGVDLDRFRGDTPPPADPPVALVVGAIVDWKRPGLALEIAALASSRLPDLRLRIAGEPIGAAGAALRERLAHRAAAPDLAGRVELLGPVEDVSAALAEATCLLHCADREPYGMALVESLACARGVVAPAAAGPTEIVDPACGVLYPPGDARAGAEALVGAIERAGELGRAGRTRAETAFDAAAARRRFGELVEGVARS
jgi:glycosyltransferase involved in cell wall biosynthesis